MDDALIWCKQTRSYLQRWIFPLIVSSIFRSMWGTDVGGVSGDKAGQPNWDATDLTWNRIEADAEDTLLREKEDALMGTPHLLGVRHGWSEFTRHRFGIPEGKGECGRIAAAKEGSLKCRGNWVVVLTHSWILQSPHGLLFQPQLLQHRCQICQ